MNELTAVFMDVLGEETGQKERAAAVVRESMLTEIAEQTKGLSSPETLFFSREGIQVKQDLEMIRHKAENLTQAHQAVELCGQLRKIFVNAEKLHRETQREIHRSGHLRAGKLHFFYADEQTEALEILEEYIKAELYRILVLGGGRMFSACKPLRGFQHTLQDRMKYLKYELEAVTDTQEFQQVMKKGYWAVVHRDEMKAGPLGYLPGYEITPPVKVDHTFVAGEHRILPYRNGVVQQGVGQLTNVQPQTVEKAQAKGMLHTEILPEQLVPYLDYLQEPDAVLKHIFEGAYYCVSPEQYFGAASYVEASAAVSGRKRLGQCIFCGQASDGLIFCDRCSRRIKVV